MSILDPVVLPSELHAADLEDALFRAGDKDVDGITVVANVKTTEIARRMLLKAVKAEAGKPSSHYWTKTHQVFGLFTGKEQKERKIPKIGVAVFREIARSCPSAVGKYDDEADALVVYLVEVPSQDYREKLRKFSNMEAEVLSEKINKSGLDPRGSRKRGRGRGSAGS